MLRIFAADVNSGAYEPVYTFIEPDYAIQLLSQFWTLQPGFLQHWYSRTGQVSSIAALTSEL